MSSVRLNWLLKQWLDFSVWMHYRSSITGNVVLSPGCYLTNNGHGGHGQPDLRDVVFCTSCVHMFPCNDCNLDQADRESRSGLFCVFFFPLLMCVVSSLSLFVAAPTFVTLSLPLRVHPNSVISYLSRSWNRWGLAVIKDIPLTLFLLGVARTEWIHKSTTGGSLLSDRYSPLIMCNWMLHWNHIIRTL